MRRSPITDMAGHLSWTRAGSVWATWRLNPLAWNRSLEERNTVAKLHRMLVRSLEGEAVLLSSMIPTDPVEIVDRMIQGLDLSQVPGWVAEVEATMDTLTELPLGKRQFWLAVPLSNRGADRWREPLRAGAREVADMVGFPVARPVTRALVERAAQAAELEAMIPSPFAPVRVTPAEQAWLHNHACRRGMVDLPVPEAGDTVEELITSSGSALVEPILDEGGRTDPDGPRQLDVLGSRFLKVIDARGADLEDMPASYQAVMALAETPAGGLAFPGSEVLFELDRTGIDVDWAIRLRVNAREKVLARNRSAVRSLNEQLDQRAAEETTGLHDLGLASELLTEYAENGQDGATLRALIDQHAKTLGKHLVDSAGMRFERLPGTAEKLWWQMLPGASRDESVLRPYRQYTTSENFARLVPVIAYRLGGESGPVLAVDKEMSRPVTVHLNPAGYPELDLSGSIQVSGELGSGKTVCQKTVMAHIVDQGGKFFSIDKSEDGEWARYAITFDSHAVVDPDDPQWSMDPLRVLGGSAGCELAASFVTHLIGLDVQDAMGRVLTRVLTPRYLGERGIEGLGGVVAELARLGQMGEEPAAELAERLAGWADKPLAAVMFDPRLPAMRTGPGASAVSATDASSATGS